MDAGVGTGAGSGRRHDLAAEVLVTGASGFLGRPLAAALAATGRQVIGLSRRPPGDLGGVGWVRGDLLEPGSYLAHLRPGMAVYHLAALRVAAGRRRCDLDAVNVGACRDLARACLDRGVRRFVLVSSASALGPSAGGAVRREEDGAGGEDHLVEAAPGAPAIGGYERSRRAGVLAVRGLMAAGLDAVVLYPTIIFGPDHPTHPNRVTGELRRLLARRRAVAILVAGGRAVRDLVYVDDVVAAALAAESLAPPGAELVLGGEEVSHRGLIDRALAVAGRPSPHRISVPAVPALAAAWVADRLLRFDRGCGHQAAVGRLLQEWRFDSGKARRLLGYRPRSLDEGLIQTLRWLRGAEALH